MRLFIEWFWERFGGYLLVTMAMIGILLGVPFVFVDIIPSLEGFRFGWFYRFAHVPSLLCLVGMALLIALAIAQGIVDWFVQQISDWKTYQEKHQK